MAYQIVSGRPAVTRRAVANNGADDILAAGAALMGAHERAMERKERRDQLKAERDLRVQLQADAERAADERLSQQLGFSRESLAAQLLPQGFVPVDEQSRADGVPVILGGPGVSAGLGIAAPAIQTALHDRARADVEVGGQGFRYDPEASSAAVLQRGQQGFQREMQDDAQEFTSGENVQDRTLQRYGIDTGAATSRYSADTGAAASMYGARLGLEGVKYSADTSLQAANIRSANNGLQNLQADDVAVSPAQRIKLYTDLHELGVNNPDSTANAAIDSAEVRSRRSLGPYLGVQPSAVNPAAAAGPSVPPADRARQLRSQHPDWTPPQIAEQMRKEGYAR